MRFFNGRTRKIGLALGSGAARGLAHIGVLRALKEKNISIEAVAGASMGALIGACYARNGDITDIEDVVLNLDWRKLAQLSDPNLASLFKGVIHGKKVEELLKTVIGDVKFSDLKIPLSVVATDVSTGEEVVINEGPVIPAVRASISIPAIFMPVKRNNRFLIDGGIVNPVPVNVVKDMGATFVIACNVIDKLQGRRSDDPMGKKRSPLPTLKTQIRNSVLKALNNQLDKFLFENKDKIDNPQKFINGFKENIYGKVSKVDPNIPSIFEVITQAIYAMEYEIAKLKVKEADMVITPDTGHIASLEFYRGQEAISAGYKAAINLSFKP